MISTAYRPEIKVISTIQALRLYALPTACDHTQSFGIGRCREACDTSREKCYDIECLSKREEIAEAEAAAAIRYSYPRVSFVRMDRYRSAVLRYESSRG